MSAFEQIIPLAAAELARAGVGVDFLGTPWAAALCVSNPWRWHGGFPNVLNDTDIDRCRPSGQLIVARRRANPWVGIGLDAWRLGLEASAVIGLRTFKIAQGGPGGAAEAELMVREKVQAGVALGAMALTGGLGSNPASASAHTLAHYRRKVRANRRRLSKG